MHDDTARPHALRRGLPGCDDADRIDYGRQVIRNFEDFAIDLNVAVSFARLPQLPFGKVPNILELQKDEKIAAMICVKDFDTSDQSIVLATGKGVVKKTLLSDYRNHRKGGIIGIKIDEGDTLIGARLTTGNDDIMLVTSSAQSIRFSESDLRDQGRATRGVRGIKLKKENDTVVAIEIVDETAKVLIAGANGLGKRTEFSEYRQQSRGGSGIIAIKSDQVVGALSVVDDDEIMMFTKKGQAVRSPIKDVRITGRAASGVKLVNLSDGKDLLIGISRVIATEEAEAGEESAESELNSQE